MSEGTELTNPACRLAVAYAPAAMRPFWQSVFAFDQRLGRLLSDTTEPMLAQIKLAWWRDRLGEPVAQRPSGDQVLDALSAWEGHEVALIAMVDGWEVLLEEELSPQQVKEHVEGRATPFARLADLSGSLDVTETCANAAQIWVLSDLVGHMSDEKERKDIVEEFAQVSSQPLPKLPKPMRPLAIMAALAKRHLREPSIPVLSRRRDALIALRVGIFGR